MRIDTKFEIGQKVWRDQSERVEIDCIEIFVDHTVQIEYTVFDSKGCRVTVDEDELSATLEDE